MFVYMKLQKWESIKVQAHRNDGTMVKSVPLVPPDVGSIGLLEVYDTRENAIKAGCEEVYLREIR